MPIEFEPMWNVVQLKQAKDPAHIAAFWLARTRLKKQLTPRVMELFADFDAFEDKANRKALAVKYGEKDHAKITKKIADEHDLLTKAAGRDKISGPIVRRFAPKLLPGKSTKDLATEMEEFHNDRLRIADVDMLKRHSALSVLTAIVRAKPRFTQDQRVAALFARAVAHGGDPVVVTQGVHQSDEPHFDVLMPGEAKQYHIEVEEGPPLKVIAVSYIVTDPQTRRDTTKRVFPDAVAVAPQVVI